MMTNKIDNALAVYWENKTPFDKRILLIGGIGVACILLFVLMSLML